VFKTYLKDDSIKTESKDGVVTLTGTVAEAVPQIPGRKHRGEPARRQERGQSTVVSGEQPAEHSDTWITMKVKTALLFHRNVSATGTTVYTKDGVVTLQGEASSMAQKELTTEYAKDIDNVKEVKNEMTIAKTPARRTQPSATKLMTPPSRRKSSRRCCRIIRPAPCTPVSTTDGVVTLSGIAKNDAEKSLVTKLATDINGVTSVINNMTIAVPLTRGRQLTEAPG
jgi:hyperosmotically inducible periplasmic protein